jgi:flagellar hook-associated protein 3 FlgL
MNKTKHKMEQLQLKGSTLKRINKPSDDPVGNVQVLAYSSKKSDNDQFLKNVDFALMNLQFVENAIVELTEIANRAKDLAISQASDFYDSNIREGVAKEIRQLKRGALGIANRRLGNKYIFSGHKTLTKPFDENGHYQGDHGSISIEVAKDFFTPINIPGSRIFISTSKDSKNVDPLKDFKNQKENISIENPEDSKTSEPNREIASAQKIDLKEGQSSTVPEAPGQNISALKDINRGSIFGQLESLAVALENNDTDLIQNLLEGLDKSLERLITERTKVGALTNSVLGSQNGIESNNVLIQERKSEISDADVAEVFMDISKQQSILKTAYKAGQGLINLSLLDFLR